MFLHILIAVLIYAALLWIIDRLAIPDPGPRVAKIVVSIIFAVTLLNEFGVIGLIDRP